MTKKKIDPVITKESPTLFAARIGRSKSYITKLKQDDRLVIEPKGKRWVVLVEASLAKIKETGDPNRKDVAARHAKARGTAKDVRPPAGGQAAGEPPEEREEMSYQKARRKNEEFKAAKQEAEYLLLIGELVEASVVKHAGAEVGAAFRSMLENLPDQIAPELVPITDVDSVHAVLKSSFEHILGEIDNRLGRMMDVK